MGSRHVCSRDAVEAEEVSEVWILPEMLAAGVEALAESKKKRLDKGNTAIAVYLAMRAVEEIARMKQAEETVH